ncbi:MAG: DUF1598 domain-containing protein [Chitinivibrionales bacterium]|nr:DUF1598 domain-containing protein [Chitinivibrionales bacterium]MBD3395603.1 DUF1598 domain-containing protein [Chitinivibrionales bacterium]
MAARARKSIVLAAVLAAGTCLPAPAATWCAFSLRAFAQRHATCAEKTPCREELQHCGGITRLMGYVVDAEHRDILLVGRAVPGRPAARTEDFVVALRNAYLKYAKRKGNTMLYAAPTCSIDPDPRMLKKLAGIGQRIMGKQLSEEEFGEVVDAWKKTCRAPQTVRILGIPRNTRFARVMVDADYQLKKLVDGSDTLSIPGFSSHTHMILNQSKKEFLAGTPLSARPSMLNRYWFTPGTLHAEHDGGTVLLRSCAVEVLTEEEMLAARGERTQTGRADALAAKFASDFGAHFGDIAAKRAIYLELENLYRFVLAAQIMKEQDALTTAGFEAGYLLEDLPVREVKVAGSVPGWSSYAYETSERPENGGKRVATFRIPSCGGVSMDIRVTDKVLVREKNRAMSRLGKEAVSNRPSGTSLSWEFRAPAGIEK